MIRSIALSSSLAAALIAASTTNAQVTDLGGSCATIPAGPDVGFLWLPDGIGGYTSIVDNTITFDTNIGPGLLADVDTLTPVTLGFPFTMPGGTVVTELQIDSNGRLILTTSAAGIGAFNPQAGAMEAEEQIAVHWGDWLTATGGATLGGFGAGDIHFITDGVGRAVITWNGVQQCQPADTTGTFQIVLNGGTSPDADSFTIFYGDIRIDPTHVNTYIGVSDGIAGATELDLFPGPVTTTATGAQWEFFDSLIVDGFDINTTPPGTGRMVLTNVTDAVIGTSFDLQLDNIPATAAFGGFGIGFANLMAPLSIIDPTNPCTLFSSLDLLIPITPGATTANGSIDLTTAGPGLVGLTLTIQGVVADLALPFTIPVTTSNGLSATIQ